MSISRNQIARGTPLLSQTAEYALRAIVCLGTHAGQPLTAAQIATSTHVSVPYLAKVLRLLSRGGLIDSQRGLHGGFTLSRPLKSITIYDVMAAVDPLPRIERCPLGIETHSERLCPLHRRLDEAMAQVEKAFQETTLWDLLHEDGAQTPLCAEEQPETNLAGA